MLFIFVGVIYILLRFLTRYYPSSITPYLELGIPVIVVFIYLYVGYLVYSSVPSIYNVVC